MKHLIITTETTEQMEAVVSFLKTAVGMQRNANAIIDFREPDEVDGLYGFAVAEYETAMEKIKSARPLIVCEQYETDKTPSYNLERKIRWGTDDEKNDLAFWMDKFFGL